MSDASSNPVTGASVELEGDMSHAGMSPVFGQAKEEQPGDYRGRLEFSMAGDWTILLHVRLANGQRLERQIEVKGVRAN
jgi:YtkA-like